MNSPIDIVAHFIQTPGFAAWFLDAWLKSFVVLAAAGGLCLALRRASAATRHLIWFLAVAALPWLPLMSSLLPSWQRPLWSVSTSLDSGNRISLSLELAPVGDSAALRGTPAQPATTTAGPARAVGRHLAAQFNAGWLTFAIVAWFGGVVWLLLIAAAGHFRLAKISRQTRRLRDPAWAAQLAAACERLQLRRQVSLLQSVKNVTPLTWGWWRPVVLLPAEADGWSRERRRVVLLHELAHVKRWDCLTQWIATMVGALYWFNPLVWLARRRMCVERESACDDLVLNGGCPASDYAGHLVEIARTFRGAPQVAAIAMARSPQLAGRITAIVDASRRRRLSRPLVFGLCLAVAGLVAAIAAQKPGTAGAKPWFDERLRNYFVAKAAQAHQLAALEKKENLSPVIWNFFDAGSKGDWTTVTNLYGAMRKGAYQYEGSTHDAGLETIVWQPVNEAYGAWQEFAHWGEKYVIGYGEGIIKSIPPGSIYFGGTDPGRWAISALCRSHVDADPFFTITQNALADSLYEEYVRAMYGGKMYMTTSNEMQQAFNDYVADAGRRLQENKLKPGERVTIDATGHTNVTGQVAVMAINALIARTIFDKNPDREFYIEVSFPLDWMYPHLSPHGLILKINRQPLPELSEEIVRKDHEYWSDYLKPMIGDWLNYDTSVKEVTAFAEKTYLRHDWRGFKGDRNFIQDSWSQLAFAKERSSIAGVYAWRVEHAANETEKAGMAREADFAFRQTFALCPYSPEAVFLYVDLLVKQKRVPDAILIAETAARIPQPPERAGEAAGLRQLVQRLKAMPPAK